jgi:hypothetical protein
MIEGPGGIYMCAGCVDAAGEIVAAMRDRGELPQRGEWVKNRED